MQASSPAYEGREEPPWTEGTICGDWTLTTPTTKTTCWCRVWPVGTIFPPMLRISFSKVLIWDKERNKLILFCICLYKVLAGTASCNPCFFESNCNLQLLIPFKALSLWHLHTMLRLLSHLLNSDKEILNFLVEISFWKKKTYPAIAFKLLLKCLHLALLQLLNPVEHQINKNKTSHKVWEEARSSCTSEFL